MLLQSHITFRLLSYIRISLIIDQQNILKKWALPPLQKDDYTNLSTSIGSMNNGVTVEENTNAFSTFANDGKFIDAYMIDKIVDKNGKVIYQHEVKPVDVFKPQTAFLTLDMMRDVIQRGQLQVLKVN